MAGMSMRLLVLEDHQIISDMIAQAVYEEGLFEEIYQAGTIAEAMGYIDSEEVDIFIVDLKLPDGSGYDFIKTIRALKRYEYSWIIIMTGLDESKEEIIESLNSNHCQRYVRKPFDVNDLVDMLEELSGIKIVVSNSRNRLKIRRKSVDYYFKYEDIIYIETVEKMVYLYSKKQKSAIGRIALNDLEEMLPKDLFMRVHRSFIINKDYIDFIKKENNQNLIKVKFYEQYIPIGRTYKTLNDNF